MEKQSAASRTTLLVCSAMLALSGYTLLWIHLCAALLHGRPLPWPGAAIAVGLCVTGAMGFGRTLRTSA